MFKKLCFIGLVFLFSGQAYSAVSDWIDHGRYMTDKSTGKQWLKLSETSKHDSLTAQKFIDGVGPFAALKKQGWEIARVEDVRDLLGQLFGTPFPDDQFGAPVDDIVTAYKFLGVTHPRNLKKIKQFLKVDSFGEGLALSDLDPNSFNPLCQPFYQYHKPADFTRIGSYCIPADVGWNDTQKDAGFGFGIWANRPVYPPCGATLTKSTRLLADMNCSGTALYLSGNQSKKVKLDCDGHSITTVDGTAIIASNVSKVTIANCDIQTSADRSHGILLTGGTTKSTLKENTITTLGIPSYPVNIQSSSNNRINENILMSPHGYVYQSSMALQNGGLGVDSNGNIYAVENNWGSRSGVGTSTAFFMIDPATGLANSPIPLKMGNKKIGFGFDALDVLPDGRILALGGVGTKIALYEIDPNTGQVTPIALNFPALDGNPSGLDATSDTSLLATTDAGELLEINLTTGNVTELGEQGTGWADIAVHPTNTDMVYTVGRSISSNTAHLYQINPTTGAVIGDIGDTGRTNLSDIDFALDGTLYGNDGFGYAGGLVMIDTGTGATASIGSEFGIDPNEPLPNKNKLKGNLFKNDNGGLLFPDTITLPSALETRIASPQVEISPNKVMVDSAVLPFLDRRALIALTGLDVVPYYSLLVDPEDDGSFVPCMSRQCEFVHFGDAAPFFVGDTLIYRVSGFTSYSSVENTDPTLEFVTAVVLAEIEFLLDQSGFSKAAKKKLKAAGKDMNKALKFVKKGDIKKGLTEISKAVTDLLKAQAKGAAVGDLIDRLVEASRAEAQAAIDAAIAANGDAALIAEAEANMTMAQDMLNQGKPDKAINFYRLACVKADKSVNGGGGGGGGKFGKLNVTGNDTGKIGGSFSPNLTAPFGNPIGGVVWTASKGVKSATSISFTFGPTGSLSYIFANSKGQAYAYQIICFLASNPCSGILVDLVAKTATFNNHVFEVATIPNNKATAQIVVDGTLTW